MPFPEVSRVRYKKNSLEKVICQLRFPPILKIDSEDPSAFQEAVRKTFPNFEIKEISLPVFELKFPSNTLNKSYSFISEDKNWGITITRTFISIYTNAYISWEDFFGRFEDPLNNFIRIYEPSYFTRIGLRFIDVFCRTKLNLPEIPWKDLITDSFLGLMSDNNIMNHVENFNSSFEIKLNSRGKVKINTRYVLEKNTQEQCFLLDSDFYIQEKILKEATKNDLDFLHGYSIRLLRYVIKEKLEEAMEPYAI